MDQKPVTSEEGAAAVQAELTNQREQLLEYLRSLLIECGWRDQLANSSRELIQKYGVEQVKLNQIVHEVREDARQKVPESVKTEILNKMRKMQQDPEVMKKQEREPQTVDMERSNV